MQQTLIEIILQISHILMVSAIFLQMDLSMEPYMHTHAHRHMYYIHVYIVKPSCSNIYCQQQWLLSASQLHQSCEVDQYENIVS